jgi:hypothetical protein
MRARPLAYSGYSGYSGLSSPSWAQDTTHIATEARNLSTSMAELVRADGVRGTAVAEVTVSRPHCNVHPPCLVTHRATRPECAVRMTWLPRSLRLRGATPLPRSPEASRARTRCAEASAPGNERRAGGRGTGSVRQVLDEARLRFGEVFSAAQRQLAWQSEAFRAAVDRLQEAREKPAREKPAREKPAREKPAHAQGTPDSQRACESALAC